MSVVIPDEGESYLLELLLKTALLVDQKFHIHLFTNNYLPNRESVVSDFVEATFAGYVVYELDRSLWSDPDTFSGAAFSVYDTFPIIWTCTSGTQDIWGYYVTDETDSVLLWAEAFSGYVTVQIYLPLLFMPFMRLQSIFEPPP